METQLDKANQELDAAQDRNKELQQEFEGKIAATEKEFKDFQKDSRDN